MGNCLLTKLKGSVDNDNLPKFGVAKILLSGTNMNITRGLEYTQSGVNRWLKAKIVSGSGYFKIGSSTEQLQEVDTNQSVTFTGEAYAEIDVYQSAFMQGCFDNDKAPWSDAVIAIYHGNAVVDEEVLQSSGTFENFGVRYPNVKYIESTWNTGYITGDLTNLVGCKKLAKLLLQHHPAITGSLESFAAGQVATGRTSGTVEITCNGTITYGGNVVADETTKTITYNSSVSGGYTIS